MKLAFLVPAPDYPEPWRWAFDAEAAALQKRGVTVDPEKFRRDLKLRGDDAATLILTRIGKRQVAIVARRLVTL